MQRDIVFRGKRTANGQWVEGDLTRYSEVRSYITVDLIENEMYEVDAQTVGQYTGLCDKNGERIFEGDILEENRCRFLVVFDQNWAKFKLQHDGHAIQYPEWNRGTRMEIIGNIHDNPELIGGAI